MGIRTAISLCSRCLLTTVTVSGILLVPAAGNASAEKKVRATRPKENRRLETREIEGIEELWRTAIVKGDAVSMEKLLSEDFLAISARGTLSDKQQYLARIANHATQLSACDLMDLKVRVQTGSAVAVSQAHIAGVLEGRPIEGTFRYTKVYGRGAGGNWQMTNFEATKVSATASGESDMTRGVAIGDKSQSTAH